MVVLWILFTILVGAGDVCEGSEKLVQHLIQYTATRTPPPRDRNGEIKVMLELNLHRIVEVDFKGMIFVVDAQLEQKWMDSRLRWDPQSKRADVTKIIVLREDEVWTPGVKLLNSAGKPNTESTVWVEYAGNVTMKTFGTFKVDCTMDVRYYPYDTQSCRLTFKTNLFPKVYVDHSTDAVNLDRFYPSSSWNIISTKAHLAKMYYYTGEHTEQKVSYEITLKRNSVSRSLSMIPPLGLLSVGLMSLLIPPSVGQKVVVQILSLLGVIALFLAASSEIPETSVTIALIVRMYLTVILVLLCTTLASIISVIFYDHCGLGLPLPNCTRTKCFRCLGALLCVGAPEQNAGEKSQTVVRQMEWKQFGLVLDRLLFIFLICVSIISVIYNIHITDKY